MKIFPSFLTPVLPLAVSKIAHPFLLLASQPKRDQIFLFGSGMKERDRDDTQPLHVRGRSSGIIVCVLVKASCLIVHAISTSECVCVASVPPSLPFLSLFLDQPRSPVHALLCTLVVYLCVQLPSTLSVPSRNFFLYYFFSPPAPSFSPQSKIPVNRQKINMLAQRNGGRAPFFHSQTTNMWTKIGNPFSVLCHWT